MKITVKTTQQKNFQVDIDPEQTVGDLKTKIEESQGHPAASQKIIFSGKILNNDQSVESCGIKEKDFLVLMVSKPKPSPVASSTVVPPSGSTSETPTTSTDIPPSSDHSVTPQPPANSEAGPGTNPEPLGFGEPRSFLTGAHLQTAIDNMVDMGFSREEVQRAMRASFNNPDRAVEYLTTGIPPHLAPEQPPPPAPPVSAPSAPATPAAAPSQPQNLFQLAQQQQQAGSRGPPLPGRTQLPAANRNIPQMQQLQQMLQENPGALQPMLQQLASSNPALAQSLAQHPDALLNLLGAAGGMEGDDDDIPPGAQVISVTEEERAAIERLQALGFSREAAVQAYFACDKNEELAANYLFENGADE